MNNQLSFFEQPEPKAIAPTTHRCHAIGCDRPVEPRFLMCAPHWRQVPHDLKQQVWLHYRAGQETRKDPTPQYMAAAAAAIASLRKPLKALTLWQPWGTLVALGLKRFETRPRTISWRNYRGGLIIHAAARKIDALGRELIEELRDLGHEVPDVQDFPLGAIVAIATTPGSLVMARPTEEHPLGDREIDIAAVSSLEQMVGDWRAGRLAIPLENVQAIAPIAAMGAQGLWTPNPNILQQINDVSRNM